MTHAGTGSGTEWHNAGYWTAAPASGYYLPGSGRSSDRKSFLQARPAQQWHEVPLLLLWAKRASLKQPEGGSESPLLHSMPPATQHAQSNWTVFVCVNSIKGLLKDPYKISMSIIQFLYLNMLACLLNIKHTTQNNLLPRGHLQQSILGPFTPPKHTPLLETCHDGFKCCNLQS